MSEKREQLMAARFTPKERKFIETYIENNDINISEFLRTAALSYIKNMKTSKPVDINTINNELSLLESAAESLLKQIEVLKDHLEPLQTFAEGPIQI